MVTHSLSASPTSPRPRVLIITGDPITERMAGPAIRVWNMAELLSDDCDVRIVSWKRIERHSPRFALHFVHEADERAMEPHERWADVIVVQGMSLRIFPSVARTQKIVVADLYDPFQLEQLEQNKYEAEAPYVDEIRKAVSLLNEQLGRGDFFLCASERQRDLWLGNLSALGRLNPATYRADPTFDSLIGIAPFGLPAEAPRQSRHAIKGTVPGIGLDDKVLIWGGGIYNWFDPVTLVEAMGLLASARPDIKLFFLSASHFNPEVPEMAAIADTVAAADRLGLTGRTVFFNDEWVAYEDRVNYLLDADLGVSTHPIHAETRFSFRTRILDYLWAGLPVVSSDGDAFAEVIAATGCGRVVPPKDAPALAEAIRHLLSDEAAYRAAKTAAESVRGDFTWQRTLSPLLDFCRAPRPAADRALLAASGRTLTASRFERILLMPRGRRRDFALLTYYLRRGGWALVREKLDERRTRRDRER
ncbi:glycosyltransferase family 4 protein [Microbacterium telephonicum]|uniref:Glycosyltransferase involved in cell wall biosynthesis n=1 Tax=Microbacterium telephonicum TaxID=1714841 RepID=A0A498C3P5_9MICO|nr:glycosyltransferase family 4 protein [Microbacterium telephonicum]RLK47750.1 glycosyltransferase involved in cell wall biosynthesis [Microbacterium telephonicum]